MAIKGSINKGLPDELKAAFTDITPVQRPIVLDFRIKDPNWLAGFTTGEGCFFINILKTPTYRQGYSIQLVFQITQHNRDELLMRSFIEFFNAGNTFKSQGNYVFKVTKFPELNNCYAF